MSVLESVSFGLISQVSNGIFLDGVIYIAFFMYHCQHQPLKKRLIHSSVQTLFDANDASLKLIKLHTAMSRDRIQKNQSTFRPCKQE